MDKELMELKNDEVAFNDGLTSYSSGKYLEEDRYKYEKVIQMRDIKSPDDFPFFPDHGRKGVSHCKIRFQNGNHISIVKEVSGDGRDYDVWDDVENRECTNYENKEDCFRIFQLNYNKAYVEKTCEHCGATSEELEVRVNE
tara:strand:+ start:593 stop:1015 length:423 start_codon:yes stop_codon:yes gene_type:complete